MTRNTASHDDELAEHAAFHPDQLYLDEPECECGVPGHYDDECPSQDTCDEHGVERIEGWCSSCDAEQEIAEHIRRLDDALAELGGFDSYRQELTGIGTMVLRQLAERQTMEGSTS